MPDGKTASDVEMESEAEEDGVLSYKHKYRQLKSRLKYLIYEHECFENDIQNAQTKLLQLSRDKSFLLDQLMRYEAVVLSGEEEDTDYSSGEEEALMSSTSTAPPSDGTKVDVGSRNDLPEQQTKAHIPPAQLTKQGIAKASAILNSIATSALTRAPNTKVGGARKQTKASSTKVSAVAAAKITKAVARARHYPPPTPPSSSSSPAAPSSLIVSLPLSVTSLRSQNKQSQSHAQTHTHTKPLQKTTVTSAPSTAAILASITSSSSSASGGVSSGLRSDRSSVISVPTSTAGSALSVTLKKPTATSKSAGSVGLVHSQGKAGVKAGVRKMGGGKDLRVSPDSSSSSSSSSSDSDDSGSDSSSSSSSSNEPEEMETGGPVPMVRTISLATGGPQIVRPKAISSPVKGPPQLIPALEVLPSSSPPHPPPLLSPLTSPGTTQQSSRFLWSNRSSGDAQTPPTSGFSPLSSALQSPPALTKPSSGSAFQLVTSPPGSATLHRPPSLQDITGAVEHDARKPPS